MSQDKLPVPGMRRSFFARSPTRMILAWLALFLVTVTVYQVFTGVRAHPAPQWTPAPVDVPEDGWRLLMIDWAWMLVGGGLFFGGIAWLVRRGRRFPQQLGDSVAAYQQGDLARADELLRAMARTYRFPELRRAQVRYTQGLVALRRGELDRAIDLFGDLAKGSQLLKVREYAEWVPAHLAIAMTLRGDLDVAERWLEETRRSRVSHSRMVFVAEALLLSRKGEHEAVQRLLEDGWREAEGALSGDWLRILRLLRAFAASRVAGPRGEGEAHELLRALRPVRPGEFAYLGRSWPDLGTFLALAELP